MYADIYYSQLLPDDALGQAGEPELVAAGRTGEPRRQPQQGHAPAGAPAWGGPRANPDRAVKE